jgi:methyl-accepting chemotaxis protein
MNSERASNNISEISRAAKEMVEGLTDISKNILLISSEAGAVQENAVLTNHSSEELLKIASGMENYVSSFKTN